MMSTETSAATPVRVPKLAVRNKTSMTSQAASQASSNNVSDQTQSSHSSTRTASPKRERGISDTSQNSKRSNTMDESARRSGSSQGKRPQQPPQQTNSKKKNGMLGFLTLKEPSTSALEQFAEQQKKAAAAKTGGRSSAVGLSSVSAQKLPEHVPKVNSKWDGLPEDARKKLEHQRKTSHEQGSLFTISSRQTFRSNNSSSDSSTSTRRPIGSISSRPSSMGSTVRAQQKYTVIHPTAKYDTTTPIAVHADPHGEPSTPLSSVHPALRAHASANQSHNLASPTSPISSAQGHSAVSARRLSGAVPAELAGRAIAELPGDGPVELPADEPPQMAGDEPAAYTTTPPGGSPLTPPANDIPDQTPRVLRPGVIVDAQGTMWYSNSDTEPEEDGSDPEAILPKPFLKRPMMEDIAESPIEYPETPEDWPLPGNALRSLAGSNSNLALTPSNTTSNPTTHLPAPDAPPTCPLPPIPSSPPERLHAPTSIFSIHAPGNQTQHRPPSLAPSMASTIDWPLPPSHRLGMAPTSATPRKADVAPWERFDAKADVLGNAGGSPTVVDTSMPVRSGTKKRFSGILGRKG